MSCQRSKKVSHFLSQFLRSKSENVTFMLYYLLVKNLQHISIRFEKKSQKKSVNGLGFFSVNGLGLNFCGIFEEKANYRSDFGKKQ